jgi:DNA repair protein RadC
MTYETIVTKENAAAIIIENATEVYRFISLNYNEREQEQMLLMTLGEEYHLKNVYLIHIGKVIKNTMDIKDIFYKTIMDKAKHIIICYLRPSSSDLLRPSGDDYSNAEKIFRATKIINTDVLYQLIIGNTGFTEIKHDDNDDMDMR